MINLISKPEFVDKTEWKYNKIVLDVYDVDVYSGNALLSYRTGSNQGKLWSFTSLFMP